MRLCSKITHVLELSDEDINMVFDSLDAILYHTGQEKYPALTELRRVLEHVRHSVRLGV